MLCSKTNYEKIINISHLLHLSILFLYIFSYIILYYLVKIIIRARDAYGNGSIVTNCATRYITCIIISFIALTLPLRRCVPPFPSRSLSACRYALKIFHFISCTYTRYALYTYKCFMLLFYMLFITISYTQCRITNDTIFYTREHFELGCYYPRCGFFFAYYGVDNMS